jgi:hypothetical protein
LWKALRPGDYVINTHKYTSVKGFGMIVSVQGTEAAVLWSQTPVKQDLTYNPLAYDEDIYIPVRCKGDPNVWCPIEGCKCKQVPSVS